MWEKLLESARKWGVELGMTFLDGTGIRAHQKEAGAARKGDLKLKRHTREGEPWPAGHGRSRGGHGTKAGVITDGSGRAVAFALALGQAHELPMARHAAERYRAPRRTGLTEA